MSRVSNRANTKTKRAQQDKRNAYREQVKRGKGEGVRQLRKKTRKH